MFLKRLEGIAASMVSLIPYICRRELNWTAFEQPDTALSEEKAASNYGPITTTSTANGTGQASLVTSAAGAAGVLAGWALTSLSKQLASAEVHSSMSAASPSTLGVPSTVPAASNGASQYSTPAASPRPITDSASFYSGTSKPSINVKEAAPAARPSSSSSGMKLGAGKSKAINNPSSLADSVAAEWEDDGDAANAWGTDDLIDVNADEDDWAAFESAPIAETVVPPPQDYYVKPSLSSVPAFQAHGGPYPAPTAKQASQPSPSKAKYPPAKASPAPSGTFSAKTSYPMSNGASVPEADGWGDMDDEAATPTSSSISAASAAAAPSLPTLAAMSKDEKDKEMARRREERKAVSSREFPFVWVGAYGLRSVSQR